MKGLYYNDLTDLEKQNAYDLMKSECAGIGWIDRAFELAWSDYIKNKFKYDGATFVRENNNIFWEVAAFIHDWLNIIGYVGKNVDLYFIKIMMELRYSENIIFERCKWMQWTFMNVFWHKVKGNFIADDLPTILKNQYYV